MLEKTWEYAEVAVLTIFLSLAVLRYIVYAVRDMVDYWQKRSDEYKNG